MNALMIASAHDHIQVVQLLLKFGADPNITFMVTGETALSIAVESGHLVIVRELLQNGASTTDTISRDINGKKIEFTMTQLCLERLITKSYFNRLVQLQPAELKEKSKKIYGNDFTLNLDKINEKLLSINTEDTIEILRCIIARSEPEDDPACLLMASLSGNKQAVDMLLNAGYNPVTPMSSSKHYQALYKGIPPTMQPENFLYPSFIIPCIEGVLEGSIAETLLKAIGDLNTQQENGLTFLMIACKFGQLDIVMTLLVNGADPNICDSNGNNALHYILMSDSSEENKLGIIYMLLSMNMNVNARNTDGVTALMIASRKGYTEVIKLLEKNNADPNVTDKKGMTALIFACMNGHHKVAEYLLMTYDADPLPTDRYGLSSLSYGAMGGHNEVISLLLSNYGFNEDDKQKALIAACYGGHKNVIKLLARKTVPLKDIVAACVSDNVAYFINSQKSRDLNAPVIESTGLTPLMIASSCGSDGVMQVLVESGADVNKQDSYLKCSPLLYAVSGSKSDSVVQYLLDRGANVNVISTMNQTPLDIAKLTELNDIAEILKRSGGETYSAIMEVMPQKVEETVQEIYVLEAMMSVVNFATQTVAASAMASLLSTSQIFSVAQMVPFVTPVDAMSPFNAGTPFPAPTCRQAIEVC